MGSCVGSVCDFAREYEFALSAPMLDIERRVQGSDYGATSWTTVAQAQAASAALELRPGLRLLEIGAGTGWPALLMARQSGCDLMLTDQPLSGPQVACARAGRDGVDARCRFAAVRRRLFRRGPSLGRALLHDTQAADAAGMPAGVAPRGGNGLLRDLHGARTGG